MSAHGRNTLFPRYSRPYATFAHLPMQVYSGSDALPLLPRPVLTIGTFDGVHRGHRAILDRLIRRAKELGGQSVLITFDPHPRTVLQPDKPLSLLQTLNEKQESLAATGLDHLIVMPFTTEFAALSAEAYVRDFLVARFHPHTLIIGYDHRFGRDRSGDFALLEQMSGNYGFHVEEIPVQEIEDSAVSSTRIRRALLAGQVDLAAELLGRPFSFSGRVERGEQRGRTIGFPTANLALQTANKLLPGNGVYAVRVEGAMGSYGGMMNIGVRPTVSHAGQRSIEVHLFGFSGDLYGQTLKVFCIARLREEQTFNGIEALKEQLGKDKEAALRILEEPNFA